mmetsp:Transcript_9411/g.31250  ORF Transcript_9411/g.31250 Transcript_9411/m.31250 type:complete len:265 (+) Transcript_9411:366-1160(+)
MAPGHLQRRVPPVAPRLRQLLRLPDGLRAPLHQGPAHRAGQRQPLSALPRFPHPQWPAAVCLFAAHPQPAAAMPAAAGGSAVGAACCTTGGAAMYDAGIRRRPPVLFHAHVHGRGGPHHLRSPCRPQAGHGRRAVHHRAARPSAVSIFGAAGGPRAHRGSGSVRTNLLGIDRRPDATCLRGHGLYRRRVPCQPHCRSWRRICRRLHHHRRLQRQWRMEWIRRSPQRKQHQPPPPAYVPVGCQPTAAPQHPACSFTSVSPTPETE